MITITVSMEWEIEEGFNYRITVSEEVSTRDASCARQRLYDQCRQHRNAVNMAIAAYCRQIAHQSTADYSGRAATRDLVKAEAAKQKGYDGSAQQYFAAAARSQEIADGAQAKADAIEVDKDWLPW